MWRILKFFWLHPYVHLHCWREMYSSGIKGPIHQTIFALGQLTDLWVEELSWTVSRLSISKGSSFTELNVPFRFIVSSLYTGGSLICLDQSLIFQRWLTATWKHCMLLASNFICLFYLCQGPNIITIEYVQLELWIYMNVIYRVLRSLNMSGSILPDIMYMSNLKML